MKKRIIKFFTAFVFLLSIESCSKEEKPKPKPNDMNSRGVQQPLDNETDPEKVFNWFTKGPSDHVEGIDVERAYRKLIHNKNQTSVIVAVIDGGFDLNHEDLQGRFWVNEKESQGLPGIDDDHNGYIDDINGWNFLGGKDDQGKNTHINQDRFESTRELIRLKKLKKQLLNLGKTLSKNDQIYYDKLDYEVTGDRNLASIQITYTQSTLKRLKELFDSISAKLNIEFDQLTIENIDSFKASTDLEQEAKESIIVELNANSAKSIERIKIRLKNLQTSLETLLNEDFDPRAEIIKDNPDDFSNGYYGNNDVTGPDALHGTHVAGIIAALRDNQLGIYGVSSIAKIMALRAIPNGDEYDKDIYFAVKYAVDNGAKIINMSFGKKYSPHKSKLDEIFKYAASKGVLLVHASGNYAHNNDDRDNYPNRYLNSPYQQGELKNWIEVGASSKYNTTALVANFSNFGKESVDIFAPGLEINSTSPMNTYTILSGTSMAAPIVSGVLSLLMAQDPKKSSYEIRQTLLKSGRDKRSVQVLKPGFGELVKFGDLSRTGAVTDAYKALEDIQRD